MRETKIWLIKLLAGSIQTNTEKIEKLFVKAVLTSLIDTDKVFCKTFSPPPSIGY